VCSQSKHFIELKWKFERIHADNLSRPADKRGRESQALPFPNPYFDNIPFVLADQQTKVTEESNVVVKRQLFPYHSAITG
jgi:hypothetical protein